MEKTLVIIKPDGLQRNLLGEIISRFERKGLKLIGCKMMRLDDAILAEHYVHHKDKPFFQGLKEYMMHSPVLVLAWEGTDAVSAVRLVTGATKGVEADAGTIRGDLAMSNQNLIHASDSPKAAQEETKRFFRDEELFEYTKLDACMIYEDVPF
ncbi:MAG: nucleoside-diphosphate kinase [Candidatus Jacksonbacteria bacterium RIFOXYC2_FULL_44_29]|nr:MAG: nucleoside-diphosphate kinase [Candidatus Jacksonbacteria bacterium RIFOXYA2_FULL_43_12]OGY78349.1 MAG: nucleoside-diphosphate kinase [Candidatus Jacksonbacteria bacterium RIFOXYD2_FULL_43_21]OGY79814.1 MAG: nucleoside-diphosphate kinase [Candidatus Jacksonbacteria bacterium RIFOXYC2_FULL_44_29]HCC49716.1 nucleoside-diphosphate kinase [Candidatus Jacksonbacteria bacterium]HCE49072.1 nucleoside-diphosphate kinase [Candidatus Jacksonbacteria bacterium]